MKNSIILRNEIETVKAAYAAKGRNPVIVPAEIRMEALLATGVNKFTFQPNKQGTPFNTEIRLDQMDEFSVTEIGVFVAKPSSSTDSSYRLFTYGNEVVFSGTNTGEAIEGLYANGVLNILKDQVQYLQNYMLRKFYKVPEIQDGLTFGYTTSGAALPNGKDSTDGSEDGFYPLVPFVTFNGQDNVDINITTPSALAAIETNSRLVVVLRGYKAYNAATR